MLSRGLTENGKEKYAKAYSDANGYFFFCRSPGPGAIHNNLRAFVVPCGYSIGVIGCSDTDNLIQQELYYKSLKFCLGLCEDRANFPFSGDWENGDTIFIKKVTSTYAIVVKPSEPDKKISSYQLEWETHQFKEYIHTSTAEVTYSEPYAEVRHYLSDAHFPGQYNLFFTYEKNGKKFRDSLSWYRECPQTLERDSIILKY